MALEGTAFFAEVVESGLHRLIVGDALMVVAFDYADEFLGHPHFLLLHHLIVAYDAECDVRRHDRKLVDFIIGEELVGYLDDALMPHLLALQVVTDGDSRTLPFEVEQTDDLKELSGWYVVDDCTVLEGSHLEFLSFHDLRL